jgi:hypothetical protein
MRVRRSERIENLILVLFDQNTRHSSFSSFYYFNLSNGMVAADKFDNPDNKVRVV